MINLSKFGKVISSQRLKQKMTQNQLAQKLLVTPQAVSKWERGESFPDIETLVLLCDEFNMNIDTLLSECFDSTDELKDLSLENVIDYLQSHHRKEIVQKLLQDEIPNVSILKVFYLLNTYERLQFLNKVIADPYSIDMEDFIILLNPSERMKLLDGLKEKGEKMYYISHLLNHIERKKYIR